MRYSWSCRGKGWLDRRAGISLLEILVAVGILVFGIYAVIRIFPPGLDIIQEGSRRMLATRIAESLAEQVQSAELALPGAITGGDPRLSPRQVGDFARQQRRIINESAILPAPIAVNDVVYCPYLLQHGPVEPNSTVEVNSAPYRRVPFADLANDGVDREQYAVDGARGRLVFDVVPYDREFSVTYVWVDSGGTLHPEIEVVEVPGGEQMVSLAAAGQIIFAGLVENSDSLYRPYRVEDVVSEPAAPSGPGACLLDPDAGVLYAHPTDAGKRVRISYTTLNWQIVREETVVNDNGRVQLAFEFVADPQNPDDPANLPIPVRVVDRASGVVLEPQAIDYRSGTLMGLQPRREIRVYYQTLDDWGVQWIPASGVYEPGLDLQRQPGEAFWHYALLLDQGTGEAALGFAPSEGGKLVRVDYLAWDAADRRSAPVTGELHTIPLDPPDPPLDPLLRWIRLSHPIVHTDGEPHHLTVRGASLKLRVLWRDNDGDLQHLDVDTYVGR